MENLMDEEMFHHGVTSLDQSACDYGRYNHGSKANVLNSRSPIYKWLIFTFA